MVEALQTLETPGTLDMFFLIIGLVIYIARPARAVITGNAVKHGGRLIDAAERRKQRPAKTTIARLFDRETGRKVAKVHVGGFGVKEFYRFDRDCRKKSRRYELSTERGGNQ